MARGNVYLEQEDIAICRAWVSETFNSVNGPGQRADDFWIAVFHNFHLQYKKHFKTYPPISASRTWESVRNHWKRPIAADCIRRSAGVFDGYIPYVGMYMRYLASNESYNGTYV